MLPCFVIDFFKCRILRKRRKSQTAPDLIEIAIDQSLLRALVHHRCQRSDADVLVPSFASERGHRRAASALRQYDAPRLVQRALADDRKPWSDFSNSAIRRMIDRRERAARHCDGVDADNCDVGKRRCERCLAKRMLVRHKRCSVRGCGCVLELGRTYRVDVIVDSWRHRRDANGRIVSRDIVSGDNGFLNLACTIATGRRAAPFVLQ